jgi:hypothetical protein
MGRISRSRRATGGSAGSGVMGSSSWVRSASPGALTATSGISDSSSGGRTISTVARKRYPRRGSVWMKRGDSALSRSARRIWLMQKLRPLSKSTYVSSPHRAWRISSRDTTSPGRLARSHRTLNGCGGSFTAAPARRSSPVR